MDSDNPLPLDHNVPSRYWVFALALVTLTTFTFSRAGGSGDVATFRNWMQSLDTYGLVNGYRVVADNYPPLSLAVLWAIPKLARWLQTDSFLIFKAIQFLSLFLTSFIFWAWTRDLLLAIGLHLALLHNSIALGYLDIYFAPTLILSLWAFSKRRWLLFAVFFTVSFLTKWQPLIILPFLFVHIWAREGLDWKRNTQAILLRVALPMGALTAGMFLIFNTPMLDAFAIAINHNILSGQALNFPWLITYYLQVTQPEQFGALNNGLARFIFTRDPGIVLLPKGLFFLFYGVTFITFFKRASDFASTLEFSILGFLAYFVFNTGVHENHLFIPAILSLLLFWLDRTYLPLTVFCVAMNILNPFLFVGLIGQGMGFNRSVGIDITVLFAFFNVLFFFAIWGGRILPIWKTRTNESE